MKVGVRTPDSLPPPIPGHPAAKCSLRSASWSEPHIVPVAYRSFDRQYIILDPRVVDRPRSDLWRCLSPRQIFATEQHAHPITDGPAITFAAYVPHAHHFNSRGGRVLPLYKDPQANMPNVAPGLLRYLSQVLREPVLAEDLIAYIAAVVSHSGYTRRFRKDLATPGIRIPLSRNPQLWEQALEIGRQVIRLHTYGKRFADQEAPKPSLASEDTPKIVTPIPSSEQDMPDFVGHDENTQTLLVGSAGRIAPVSTAMWQYTVGGKTPTVVKRWIGYRLKRPRGHVRTSPLDEINAASWTLDFNNDLLDLLNVIGCLLQLEPRQDMLLEGILSSPLIDNDELKNNGILPVPPSAEDPQPLRPQEDRLDI